MTEPLHLTGTLAEQHRGLRLDQALAQLFTEYSRGQISKWIKAGYVQVNQQQLRPKDQVKGGEQIEINAVIDSATDTWIAQAIPLDIIYEDDAIIIVNKVAGMVVHPGAGNQHGTLVNALLHHAPQLTAIPRAGIVHRIDKDTSGLLMIAKTLAAHHALVKQLQQHTVIREYQAIVNGVMSAGGTVEQPIGRHPVDRKRQAVIESGKPAITHYRVEQRYRSHTQIRCQLETGRTHQIRVHMAAIHYPLLGDPVYAGRSRFPKGASPAIRSALQGFKRQALHAGVLGFIHPSRGEQVSWQVAIPKDMQQIVKVLQQDATLH